MPEAPIPALARLDAALLDGIVARGARWLSLGELIGQVDDVEHWVPTFDDGSYGLSRLVAAGFVEVHGSGPDIRVRATPQAIALRRGTKDRFSSEALGVKPWGEPEIEDRSLGPLRGLEPEDWDAAVRAYHAASTEGCLPWLAAGCLGAAAAVGGIGIAVRSVVRRRRPPR